MLPRVRIKDGQFLKYSMLSILWLFVGMKRLYCLVIKQQQ